MIPDESLSTRGLIVRGVVGGILMGLANLVPGISGGTMLLAVGVYPAFIAAIAALTTLRIRVRAVVLLGTIVGSAVLAILLLAGTMRDLVVEQRWAMYSIFIGLTLGGVPLVWRMARPATPGLWIAAAASFVVMAAMAFGGVSAGGGEANALLLAFSGLAAASAMILPGVSGGYLLLLLGQYEPILGAIDTLKVGLLGQDGGGFDMPLVLEAMHVVIPVGIGVAIGVVGVSNLLKWLLQRYEKPTLGVLLGLLLGAVVGLYPFQRPVAPDEGYVHRGVVLDATEAAALDEEYWPLERFRPTAAQVAGAGALLLAGLAGTLLVDRMGRGKEEHRHADEGPRQEPVESG